MLRRTRILPLALLLAAASMVACGSDASSPAPSEEALPPDEIEAIPFSTTKILGAPDLAELTAGLDGTLSFRTTPAPLQTIAVGEVIVAGLSPATPAGLLRVVTEVRRNGEALELSTQNAPIQLAFRKLHVKLERDVADFGKAGTFAPDDVHARSLPPLTLRPRSVSPRDLGFDAAVTIPLDFLLFDGDGDASTSNDQIGIKGSLGGGIRFGLSIDVDWDDIFNLPKAVTDCVESLTKIFAGKLPDCSIAALLPEVKVGFHADPHMEANVKVEGSASLSYEKEFKLGSISLTPIAIGPLVFIPSVDITAKVEGGAAAGFVVGAHGGLAFTSSVDVSSKSGPSIKPLSLKKAEFKADDTQVTLAAHAKAGVGARLNLQLYGIVGPYAEAVAYAEVKADLGKNPCWDLHVGLDGALGIKVSTPSILTLGSIELLNWRGPRFNVVDEVLASGTCKPVPKGPALPPGSGPDAASLGSPSFTPWARAWGPTGSAGAIHAVIQPEREWTDLALAIDHRYVTVGKRTDAVVKFDDAGALVWSRRYRREAATPLLTVIRVANTSDAALMLLASANDGEGWSLLKVGQNGGVYFRKKLGIPASSGCAFEPTHLVRDAGTGFYVLGTCAAGDRAALVHVDAEASVLSARFFGEPGKERTILPTSISVSGDEVTVLGSGSTSADGATMFALRVAETGAPAWANRYVGCQGYKDLLPTFARKDINDGVTLAGSASHARVGLVGRIRKDGSLAFANFPGIGNYTSTPFPINAAAELPTTGILVAGSTADLDAAGGTPESTTSLFVASLDAIGRPLWARSYRLANNRSASFASLRLTDDGGAVVSAVTGDLGQPAGGLTAMKIFAKDGDLGSAGVEAGITVAPMAITSPSCAVSTVPWSVAFTEAPAATEDVPTLTEDGSVH